MNLVKAADDIKNLSDQQLLSAGQNPVMVPPYLVLAEMKRREQLRAQYAKSQQQQQQPSVAQQVAQNLTQPQMGQPQQGAPQQPPPQGIMQAAPPQAMAMAQGGHVARYADGGKGRSSSMDDFLRAASSISRGYEALAPTATAAPAVSPNLAMNIDQLRQQFASRPVQDYLKDVESLYGKRDYGSMEELVGQQMTQAQARKPRIGDALIAAGAAMAANRDPRVGITNLLAQAIGAGSQTYEAAKERQQKDLQTAMMAKVALDKMKQEDYERRVGVASQMAQADRGKLISEFQTVQANLRSVASMQQRAQTEAEKQRLEAVKAQLQYQADVLKTAVDIQKAEGDRASRESVAKIRASASSARGGRGREMRPNIASVANLVKGEIDMVSKQLEMAMPSARQPLEKRLGELMDRYNKLSQAAEQQEFTPAGGITGAIPTVNPRFSKMIGQR